ncbi:MAG TPA: exosortase A [Stellaceae bacterium]
MPRRVKPPAALAAAADSHPVGIAPPIYRCPPIYRWWTAAGLIGLASLVLALVFAHDVGAAVHVWIASTAYNHCFLILPLVGFLLWERRAAIASASPAPAFWPLALMPLISAVWLIAAILDVNEGRQLALVAMFEIVLLATLGPRVFRLLLAPLLFLFFLVPTGAFLVPSLQTITAKIVVAGLHAVHIPVFSDGYMIEIPEGNFEIAEACAGLRFLIASTVFGCFFAVVMYRSWLRRAAFILLSLTVPIGANGLRALGILVLAHLEGSATAVEADHILYGWLFFSLVILLLIAIGMSFVDKSESRDPPPARSATGSSSWRFAVVVPAAVLLAVAGPAYANRLDSRSAAAPLPPASSPAVNSPWRAVADSRVSWRPVVHGANRQFLQSFVAPGSGTIIRYVALYRLRAVGNALTNSDNRIADDHAWRVAEREPVEISVDGQRAGATATQIVSGPHRRLVWSFYLVDGTITAGQLRTKLLQARAVLLQHAPLAAFVAISASMHEPGDRAQDQLERFLGASQPLSEYLDRLEHGSAGHAAVQNRRQPGRAPG